VWLVPIGNSYLITGPVTNYSSQGFYANPGGTDVGVEFGDGSYFDATSGLYLLTDAEIQGDLEVAGIGAYLFKHRTVDGAAAINTVVLINDSVLFLDLSIGVWELHAHFIYSAASTQDFKSGWTFSGTWSGSKSAHGVSPFVAATTTVAANNGDAGAARNSSHDINASIQYGRGVSASALVAASENAAATVTVAGRWTLQHSQRVATAGNQTLLRAGSWMSARKVG
jgi:hypothetical protein